ncbi:YceI family protein [Leucobacter soli]|uniref:Lipid/polyisoprenoid-binding YceI-like domain-containing protein n=1 Tax=Leucobacter soli TaxID=2812850 RepID=A0A916JW12_9MICO|nr:YceI family protein [Leucobacter soli]CAG7604887.1 hypothetical protein LEUCIP111803_00774 [Leucobacter soli]
MTRRAKIAFIVVASVLAIGATAAFAGPVIYRDFIAPPAADIPELTIDDSALDPESGGGSAEEPDADGFSGTWAVEDGSEAGYRVDEVLNGTDVTVTGRTSQLSGTVTIDGLAVTAASIEVDVASIATDNGSRDDYFTTQAMRTGEHPTATFELTEPAAVDSAPAAGDVIELDLEGELTLAGVTQSVTFPVQLQADGDTAQVVGRIAITFADYGVEAPSLGFVKVEPEGYVEFDLSLARQG